MAIPGVTTIIRDRFYTVSRTDTPAGPRIVVIAKRKSGASNSAAVADLDVVRASNEADVISAFGDGSGLHKAFIELVTAGAERVYLVPLPADTVFDHDNATITSATFGGTAAELLSAAFAAAEAAQPDILVAWGRGGNGTDWESPATPSDAEEFGFHANNSATYSTNWAYKVGLAVQDIAQNTNPCIAIMGIKPYAPVYAAGATSAAEKMTPGQVSSHLALATLPTRNSVDQWKAVGPYICVVAAEVKPVGYTSGTTDFGYSNGACSLAATMSRLASYSSIINKPLYNVESLRYTPSRTQQTSLSDKGVNTVLINFNKVSVFGEGLTFAQSDSDYTRLSTRRIINDATNLVRQVCQKFIGEPSNIQVRNSMETAITSAMRGMQLTGALLGSDFTVSYIPTQNKAIVDLVLTPAFELKTIEVQVAINL